MEREEGGRRKSQGGLGSFHVSAASDLAGGAVAVQEKQRQNDEIPEKPVSELSRRSQRKPRRGEGLQALR